MTNNPTYEELAELIARDVHQILDTGPPYFGEHRMVDDMGSTAYQIATGVLERLDVLRPLHEHGQVYEFTCEPDDFAEVIARNKDKGCSYDTLVVAVLNLAQRDDRINLSWLRNYCARIGLCEPVKFASMKLTEKGKAYDLLSNDWIALLEESEGARPPISVTT